MPELADLLLLDTFVKLAILAMVSAVLLLGVYLGRGRSRRRGEQAALEPVDVVKPRTDLD